MKGEMTVVRVGVPAHASLRKYIEQLAQSIRCRLKLNGRDLKVALDLAPRQSNVEMLHQCENFKRVIPSIEVPSHGGFQSTQPPCS